MKQFKLLSFLFVAVLCLGFTSCSDDDDPTFEDSQIVGTWTVTKYESEEGIDPYEDGEWIFTFENNGDGHEFEYPSYSDDFKWSLSNGNQITFKYDMGDELTYKILQLNNSNCIIEAREKYQGKEYFAKISLKKYNLPK